jgi:leucyl-tRNA synthetase
MFRILWDFEKGPLTDIDDAIVFNSDFLNEMPVKEAIEKVIDYLEEKGWGKRAVNYHLRDWIFSRQHYWGEPIPVVFCPSCAKNKMADGQWQMVNMDGVDYAIVPVPEDQLPVKLPDMEKYQPTDTGESPLANIKDWVETTCPTCGGPAKRETDTMPQWAGSSWYYLRFCDPNNKKQFADRKLLDYWMAPALPKSSDSEDEGGVDIYLGGAEHTTLHLLYSRFWHKVLNDLDLVPGKEPYQSRRQHGVILGEDGFKMSKSRGNVINPTDMVEKIGADALRLYLLFMGPYETTMPWDTKGTEGTVRFLNRVWKLSQKQISAQTPRPLSQALNKMIKKVGEDIDNLKFNTAIAAMMEFINVWQEDKEGLFKEDLKKFILILAPFAPHMTEELWNQINTDLSTDSHGSVEISDKNQWESVHLQAWPEFDKNSLVEDEVVIVVQVNGKLRGQIKVQSAKLKVQSEIEEMAKKEEGVSKFLTSEPKKVIYIKGKLINFVV